MAYHIRMIESGEYDLPYNHPSPVILDVGANIGGFAVWAADRWPGCEIFCYEPLPDNFVLLKANISLINSASRVHIHHCAIGDPKRTKLFLGRNNCGEASFFDLGEQQQTAVEVTTVAPAILPRAQILKLDTEGCEVEILSGLALIDYDVVLLEYHSEADRRRADGILHDYALVGGYARGLHRGILKYVHVRLTNQPSRALGPEPGGIERPTVVSPGG